MELKCIFINESTAKSIITDTYTFACFVACLFLNYYYLGNSTVLKVFICAILILSVWARGSKTQKRMTPEEALKYLSDNKPLKSENHQNPVCNICGGDHFDFECPDRE